ncbi:hypothetical protein [Clostridium scatologenes]|uniref:Uncharacterized protein n=1 Tax=Clostridium scatologenes TaxID=1548 RepID=A0A0E3MB23_CLOSL|nr:hypothetical protein [Clostridium scatologenes]AKA71215.1 hypothetical protein CSCA_4090 [Clostridium scatologenes]
MGINIIKKNTANNTGNTGTGGGTASIKQLVKLNVAAGHTSTIDNTANDNFKTMIDVYKLANPQGTQDIVKLLADFNNSESSNFSHSNNVVFDGDMKLKTNFTDTFQKERDLGTGTEYTLSFDKSLYKTVTGISNNDLNLNIQAIPQDELVVANSYIDLSGVQNIDKFTATGSEIKIVVNNGTNWFTWDGNNFTPIEANPSAVLANGIDINTFNNIPSNAWNDLLLTSKKVKFGYLLSMNNITDNVKASSLNVQIDLTGYYTKALAGTDYTINLKQSVIDVIFNSDGSYIVNYL